MIYRMEGYAELSQSIDIALLEYNLFAPKDMKVNIDPQDKLNAFIAYWQHYQNYHLGDVEEPTYWSNTEHINIELINRDKFIGRY